MHRFGVTLDLFAFGQQRRRHLGRPEERLALIQAVVRHGDKTDRVEPVLGRKGLGLFQRLARHRRDLNLWP